MEPPHQQPTSPQQAYYLPAGMAAVPPAAAPVYAAPPLQQAAPPMGAMPAPAALGGGGMQQQLLPQQQQLMGQPAAAVGAKRPLDDASAASPRGAADAKRLHVEGQGGGAAATPRETVYRLVLDVADTALIIGRGGNTVRAIEQATGGRIKRLQEPPGCREQTVVIWNHTRETPSPGRASRNTAQEALVDCVRRVVFQENAPQGQPSLVRMLIGRSQEQGVLDNMGAILAGSPGVDVELKRAAELPPCALDNDVMVLLRGERHGLMAAVEVLSHVLREHPVLERPGGAPPALRALMPGGGVHAAPPVRAY